MLYAITDELKKVAADFYDISHISLVLYDDNRNIIYSDKMCPFCEEVRKSKELAKKCIECDNSGFDICDKTKKPHIYRCHMNLAEAISPIVENGITIGYMMLGQILTEDDAPTLQTRILQISQEYGLDKKSLFKKAESLRVMNLDSVNSAVNIMSMCACYLYVNKIIKSNTDILSYHIKDYINTHIADKLSVGMLCQKFYISKSKLYAISKESFGMGISDYIRFRRLELAKNLLAETTVSLAAVAELSGFGDANYFIRIFKKHVGQTPHKYRKASQGLYTASALKTSRG